RIDAIYSLASLDVRAAAELVRRIFEQIPNDAKGPYWLCAEAELTDVVAHIDEDDLWKDYLPVVRRSTVGLKLQMLDHLNRGRFKAKLRDRRIRFLAAFLDDATARTIADEQRFEVALLIAPIAIGYGWSIPETNPRFDGPCAAFTIPHIEVRDFAAMKLAW